MLYQACVLLENYNIWKMKLFLSSVLTHFDSNVTSGLHSVGWCVTLKKHHLSPFCQHPKLGSTSFQGLPYQETVSLTTPNIRRLFKIHPKYTPIRKTTGTLTSPHLHIRRHSRGVGSAHVYSRRNWSLLLRPLAPPGPPAPPSRHMTKFVTLKLEPRRKARRLGSHWRRPWLGSKYKVRDRGHWFIDFFIN